MVAMAMLIWFQVWLIFQVFGKIQVKKVGKVYAKNSSFIFEDFFEILHSAAT